MGLMQKDTREGVERQGRECVHEIESDFQAWMILGLCEVSSLLEVGPYCLLMDFPDPEICLSTRPLMIRFYC